MFASESITGFGVDRKTGFHTSIVPALVSLLGTSEQVVNILLERAGTVQGLRNIQDSDVSSIRGLGPSAVVKIRAAFLLSESCAPIRNMPAVSSSHAAFLALPAELGVSETEQAWILLMDHKNRVIKTVYVGNGTQNACIMDPKQICTIVARSGAYGIILAHNHPSGSLEPSERDWTVTKAADVGMKAIGCVLNDHIIIGGDKYLSMRNHYRSSMVDSWE